MDSFYNFLSLYSLLLVNLFIIIKIQKSIEKLEIKIENLEEINYFQKLRIKELQDEKNKRLLNEDNQTQKIEDLKREIHLMNINNEVNIYKKIKESEDKVENLKNQKLNSNLKKEC